MKPEVLSPRRRNGVLRILLVAILGILAVAASQAIATRLAQQDAARAAGLPWPCEYDRAEGCSRYR